MSVDQMKVTIDRLQVLIRVLNETKDGYTVQHATKGKKYNATKLWSPTEYSAAGMMWIVDGEYESSQEYIFDYHIRWMIKRHEQGLLYVQNDGTIVECNKMPIQQLIGRLAKWFGIPFEDAFRLFGYGTWPAGHFVGRAPWNATRLDIRMTPISPSVVAENTDAYIEWLVRMNDFKENRDQHSAGLKMNLFYEITPLSLQ